MTETQSQAQPFTLTAVVQAGRLTYEAVLLVASLRAQDPAFAGRVILMEPQPGPLWPEDPRIEDPAARDLLLQMGAEILPFENRHFGARYPYGNKIEGLAALPPGPFLFLDTDTLVTGALSGVPFDFSRPAASMRREGTWPQPELYGPGYTAIWRALFDRFGLDFASSLDLSQPDEYWQRYLYFNAGWFLGADPQAFGARFLDTALSILHNPLPELVCQSLDPWLDQVALPLVIHAFGGGRPGPELAGMDGDVTCHWRVLPLFFARESDHAVEVMMRVAADPRVQKVLRAYGPMKRMLEKAQGAAVRALFDRADLPRREQAIRNRIKREGLWVR
ncbi:MAG: hypothetical protein ACK4L4_13100 [Gemmobacter sp.]